MLYTKAQKSYSICLYLIGNAGEYKHQYIGHRKTSVEQSFDTYSLISFIRQIVV